MVIGYLILHTLSQLQSGELHGIKRLSLAENLTEFPLEILSLADSLEILDLSNNQLTTLPKDIAKLINLKVIFASNNLFETLPEVLGLCVNLEMVGFKSNRINKVSAAALPEKLRWLILTDNLLESLPDALGERPRLQKLALAGNRLLRLPTTLSECENLELIRISANQLQDFPVQLLELPKLAWLAFAGNPFCLSELTVPQVPLVSSSSYTLLEVLGQGASGIISKAQWKQKQRNYPDTIAVKVFKGEVTSDGYPTDELQACLQVGEHRNLVQALAQVNEKGCSALVMTLIPENYKNLGLPPSFESCTRDTFPDNFSLSVAQINKIAKQMESVFEHLHSKQVCHGDLYAHNTLFDSDCNIIFGDFGAASMYHMLTAKQQQQIKTIERRAFQYFIDDLISVCEAQEPHYYDFNAGKLLSA